MTPTKKYYAALIPQLAAPYRDFQWRFDGFGKWASREYRNHEDWEEDEWRPRIVPDAWALDEKKRLLYLLEFVESNDISEEKAAHLSDCFWSLDAAEWQTVVVIHYPTYARTMEVWNLMFLEGTATRFEGRSKPYHSALMTMRREVTA